MTVLSVADVAKTFTLHVQGGAQLPVLQRLGFDVAAGEALALTGPSGVGKSTLMKMLYGNYATEDGAIRVRHQGEWIDLAQTDPRSILRIRRHTVGYVSQFLRVIPRVPTVQIVAEPLRARGIDPETAEARARAILQRLNLPEPLWSLSPVTFSGGEQQRVNLARGFVAPYPLLLLDEPTASLDQRNRDMVVDLIKETRDAGTAIIGIFHDDAVRAAIATRELTLTGERPLN